MHHVHTYRAASVQEALDQVRRELGGDAVIVDTRRITQRRLLPWSRRRHDVEVVAHALADGSGHGREGGERRAESGERNHTLVNRIAAFDARTVDPRNPEHETTTCDLARDGNASTRAFRHHLGNVQRLLDELDRSKDGSHRWEPPEALAGVYLELLERDVEPGVARDLVAGVGDLMSPSARESFETARPILAGLIQTRIQCSRASTSTADGRSIRACVGPAGAGKTAVVAGLAAEALEMGQSVALIALDECRIGALERLNGDDRTADLPKRTVATSDELSKAIDEFKSADVVLIDVSGFGTRDASRMRALGRIFSEAAVDETHLVVSLASTRRSLENTLEAFRTAVAATSLILTNIDRPAGPGGILSIAGEHGLPVSRVARRRGTKHVVEPATTHKLIELILADCKQESTPARSASEDNTPARRASEDGCKATAALAGASG